jgi:hypothetical protein
MHKRNRILTLVLLALPLGAALGQDNASPQSGSASPDSGQQSSAPAPAFGADNQAAPVMDNPPISGIDQPGLEPHAAPLSYLQPGLHLSEAGDSNVTNTLGTSSVQSSSRALGSLELQRLWSHYDLALDYLGGVGYYSASGVGFKDVQQFDVAQKITWKRGQLGVRDSFSYLPEGTFGAAYGATGLQGDAVGAGIPGIQQTGTIFGAVGQVPRITNETVADVVESLSPKSSLTAAVGYGLLHFTGNTGVQGISFIGSQQFSAETGYDRVVGKHDQIALVYGYQQFDFSVSDAAFHSNIAQVLWGHRISGRMDFVVGAGPQFTTIDLLLPPGIGQNTAAPPCQNVASGTTTILECPYSTLKLSATARVSLRYRFPKTEINLTYDRFNTDGSGIFAGAETQYVHFSASRPLNRVWTVNTDLGYSRNSREVPLGLIQLIECGTSCPSGVSANTFDDGYAGVALHRMLGRTLHMFVSYQFNEVAFDSSFCGYTAGGTSLAPCNRISQRHIGTIGLDWTPRPIRLD